MLLAIDCGNTNTVFSIWDGARFIATWRIATRIMSRITVQSTRMKKSVR